MDLERRLPNECHGWRHWTQPIWSSLLTLVSLIMKAGSMHNLFKFVFALSLINAYLLFFSWLYGFLCQFFFFFFVGFRIDLIMCNVSEVLRKFLVYNLCWIMAHSLCQIKGLLGIFFIAKYAISCRLKVFDEYK